MKFSTFVLLMAVLVVVLAFDTNGNAGDSAPVTVAEPVRASPIIKRIRQRSVTVEAGKVERDLSVCGPNGCRTVTRSSVVESAPVRRRGKLFSRLFNRRSRSVSVSRSLGCSK